MDTLAKSEWFFFVTTVAVIVVAAALTYVLVYLGRVLRDLNDISRTAKGEAEHIVEDLRELRHEAKKEGVEWRRISRSTRDKIRTLFRLKQKGRKKE